MKSKIKDLIDSSNSILLLTHEDPDGDAIGSVLGIYHYLSSINKSVDMVILEMPKVFNFLPSIEKVRNTTDKNYDLGIVVDCSTFDRIGQNSNLLSCCKNTLCIDHHISNTNYCNFNYVEGNISSCCQVVYSLFKDWNISFNKEIGTCLVAGMLTDTNGFSINNVDSNTYMMASFMLDMGINIYDIYQKVLLNKTMSQYNLMKIGMERLEFLCDGKVSFTYILESDFEKVGALIGEHEGIVNIGKNINGVLVSILIREDNGLNVSLRSTGDVDVSKIALQFGGGGHKMAAGFKANGSIQETKENIIDKIKLVL